MENITEEWVVHNFYGNPKKTIHKKKLTNSRKQQTAFNTRKQKAIKRGVPFEIEISDLVYPAYCPILGIKLSLHGEDSTRDTSPSIDRIDTSQGYIKGNVQIISNRANRLKSDGTIEEFKKVLDFLEKQEYPKNSIS